MNCVCKNKFLQEENHTCTEKLKSFEKLYEEYKCSSNSPVSINQAKSIHSYIFKLIEDEEKYFNEEYIVAAFNFISIFPGEFSGTEKK